MDAISKTTSQGVVEGYVDPKFTEVLDVFVENFERRDELGASVCINIEGRTVVDLWGGRKTEGGEAWDKDTLSVVFSSTKGASALCGHMAADRGLLDFDALVTKYWPQFGQAGKEEALVSMMFDHSVGLPHVRTPIKPGDFNDYDYMIGVLEKEEPFWKPGVRNGYHGVTLAWTIGEMVHRSTGTRMGKFFDQEVAGPLGLDFWIGLPEEHEPRVAPMTSRPPGPNAADTRIMRAARADRSGPSSLFIFNAQMNVNSRECHAAEIGSANGISNARGLAGMYAPLANGGELNGVRLVGADTLARMGRVAMATHEDATLAIPTRFGLGYMKTMDNRKLDNAENCSVVLSEAAFGHVGAGGSIGFADPECKMGFGYTMNRMGAGILLNDRGQGLVDAAYRALGYRGNESGAWVA